MARQPLPEKYHKGPYSIGITVVEQRPELFLIIGKCAAAWSFVEHQMAVLLGQMMEVAVETSVAVFSALRTAPIRRDALFAAAELKLSDEMFELCVAIVNAVRRVEAQRNDVVHGHWGVSDAIPDGLLWIESKHHSTWNAEVLAKEEKGIHIGHAGLVTHLFVYKRSDLEGVYSEITAAWRILFEFTILLRTMGKHPNAEVTADRQFRQLCDEPHVREELSRLRAARERNQQVQPKPPEPAPGG